MEKKITKREMYEAIKTGCTTGEWTVSDVEIAEFCDNEIALLDKKAIKAKEKELSLAENKNEASKILSEKGISLSLVDFVVADDADTMKANIDLLDKAFKASVKAEVEKRLGSNNPKKNLQSEGSITKEQFRKMNIAQQSELFKTNPDLYKRLVAE